MGVFEAGCKHFFSLNITRWTQFQQTVGPAIPLYFSFFYTKDEMGLRMAYWFGFAAVAGAFGGLIAFGVQEAHTAISNWKLLFIIEVRYFHSFSQPNRFSHAFRRTRGFRRCSLVSLAFSSSQLGLRRPNILQKKSARWRLRG